MKHTLLIPFSRREYQRLRKRNCFQSSCFISSAFLSHLTTFKKCSHHGIGPRVLSNTCSSKGPLKAILLHLIMHKSVVGSTRIPLSFKCILGDTSYTPSYTFGDSGSGNNSSNHHGHGNYFWSDDDGRLFAEETIYLLSRKRRPSPKIKQRWSWTKILLITNIIVFLIQMATADQLVSMGAKVNELISSGQFYRLLTPIFLHGNIAHLTVNCYSLYALGPTVERCFGSRRFIILYLFSGFCGCVSSFFFSKNPSLGASGAIFGLVGGFAVYLQRHQHLFGETSRLGLFSIAQSLIFNMIMSFQPGSRIDNWGHVGGFVGGLLYSYIFGPNLERKRIGTKGIYLQDKPLIKQWISQWKKNPF